MAGKDDGETGITWHLEGLRTQAPSSPARPAKPKASDRSFEITDLSVASVAVPSTSPPEFPQGLVDSRSGPSPIKMLNTGPSPQYDDPDVEQPTNSTKPSTSTKMLNIATPPNVKQRNSTHDRYLGVRISSELFDAIAAIGGSRSETIRELLRVGLDVKRRLATGKRR
jgi:hypothetical protein